MEIRDYNGEGRWSKDALLARYQDHVKRFHVKNPLTLVPEEHSKGSVLWVYPIMLQIIQGMKLADQACLEIGVEFVEEDQKMPFGRILKSNSARELRRAKLNPGQVIRLRKRIMDMLISGNTPREYKEYAKLLRKIGMGEEKERLNQCDRGNPHVARWHDYFSRYA